ncbi:MAG: stage V sporulation protein SpoVM [Oscillospiraceae bacterium]|nr:stage V sporulation protein SpoVM [Oscillospiraceae bacterium]
MPPFFLSVAARHSLKGGERMKIVIWKSPKLFSGILRRLFGIKKED